MQKDTAILLFSRSAAGEAREKNFAGHMNKRLNGKIAKGFYKSACDTAISANLSLHIINEHHQKGETFGEKLSNAIEEVFNIGYEKLIVIGNDCPQLTVAHIEKAAHALDNNNVVLGPDNHGGVYLIGLTKNVFTKEVFETKQWQTASLFNQLQSLYFEETFFQLPQLADVNTFEDLKSIKDSLPATHKLKALVISLLASLDKAMPGLHIFYSDLSCLLLPLRAPPVY